MSCPANVAAALATLPWVEPASIQPDRRSRQVKFTVKDRAQFNFQQLKDVVADAGYAGSRLLVGPTDS